MKKILLSILALLSMSAMAQSVFKSRPDAFPWQPDAVKASVNMATTVAEMADWDRYPTYETYVAMMHGWEQQYPQLCQLDTIGTSVQGRLILSMKISNKTAQTGQRPEFFYSSTMHGDEVTGYYFMLRLIDTLLSSYGTSNELTQLVNTVDIYINPLSNPDGTYHGGNSTVAGARRYNANNVDLNRNFPDPFGTDPLSPQQQENTLMIAYMQQHHFILSANLHGGSEVMNYPWDSFTTSQRVHPDRDWWISVGKRFVDTTRLYNSQRFKDVNTSGVIDGGDWYVISNGRQDYVNEVLGCHEITMELSTQKTLNSSYLCSYWNCMCHSLINYIREIYNVPGHQLAIALPSQAKVRVYPNPAHDIVYVECVDSMLSTCSVLDMGGKEVLRAKVADGGAKIDVSALPTGIYMVRSGNSVAKMVKY